MMNERHNALNSAFASPTSVTLPSFNAPLRVCHAIRRSILIHRHISLSPTGSRADQSRRQRSVPTVSLAASKFSPHSCRVAIVGGGVSGLATALALVRTANFDPSNIHIFESRPDISSTQSSFSSVRLAAGGAALNLSGGAAILTSDYDLPVADHSALVYYVVGRATSGRHLFSIDIKGALRKLGQPSLIPFPVHTIMRADLLHLLSDAVTELGVNINRAVSFRVTAVTSISEQRPCLSFQDGTQSDPFDLVIGADGVRSAVRKALVGEEASATYTGFRVTWAICPRGVKSGALTDGHLSQWFGDGGYVLHYQAGPSNDRCELLALAMRQPERTSENPAFDPTTQIKQSLGESLVSCKMPQTILDIYENATDFIDTGVYAHKPTPRWSSNGSCVLVGDSAHAMAPFLGQGANQAIQDAHALGLAFKAIGRDYDCIEDALQRYERIRRPPTEAIVRTSSFIGLMETQSGLVGTTFRNSLFRVADLVGALDRTFALSCVPRVE